MKKGIKRIKESITKEEYKKLLHFTSNDINIKDNSKQNLLRTFTILYFTGLRLNELQQMKLQHIKELLENGVTKLILPKTKSERKLFASKEFKKELNNNIGIASLDFFKDSFESFHKKIEEINSKDMSGDMKLLKESNINEVLEFIENTIRPQAAEAKEFAIKHSGKLSESLFSNQSLARFSSDELQNKLYIASSNPNKYPSLAELTSSIKHLNINAPLKVKSSIDVLGNIEEYKFLSYEIII